jgi:hypothetical protein
MVNIANGHKAEQAKGRILARATKAIATTEKTKTAHGEKTEGPNLKRTHSEIATEKTSRPKKRARIDARAPHSRDLVFSLYYRLCSLLGVRTRDNPAGDQVTPMDQEGGDQAPLVAATERAGMEAEVIRSDEGGADRQEVQDEWAEPGNQIWVMKWIDYPKFGLGYVLSNYVTGVSFVDYSKIALDPSKQYVDPCSYSSP